MNGLAHADPSWPAVSIVAQGAGSTRAVVQVEALGKVYDQAGRTPVCVLQDIDLNVAPGEFVSIVGPSGCGKSTILKLIAGLSSPTSGTVRIGGAAVGGPVRDVGFMFQNDGLLPWCTAAGNIAVGLELGGYPANGRARRLAELVRMVGLENFADFYPAALSGGMRQRAALARTLAYEPSIFLMDEPFGALDAQTKIVVGREFLRIWAQQQRTVLFVTHDIGEAITMSDRIVVMSSRPGRIVAQFQVGLPRPRDFVKDHGSPEFARLYQQVWDALAAGSGSQRSPAPFA